VIGRFHLLKPALAAVLLFVGAKMLLLDVVKVPIALSLGVVACLIAGGVVASLVATRGESASSAGGPTGTRGSSARRSREGTS
jgi:tellurite resistance protein TerC